MIVTISKPVDINICWFRCTLPVRYGNEDMPTDFPFRKSDVWDVVIDVDTGKILDWPQGMAHHLHMKVGDAGIYDALNSEWLAVARKEGFVPTCIPQEYISYINFHILADGTIDLWTKYMTRASLTRFLNEHKL